MATRRLVGLLALAMVFGAVPLSTVSASPPSTPRSAPTGVNGSFSSLGSGLSSFGEVNTLHLRGDSLYVGGLFSAAGGVSATNVAVWSRSQAAWSPLGSGVSERVFGFATTDDSLFVGGAFCFAGDPSVCGTGAGNVSGTNFTAAWSQTGQSWSSLNGGMSGDVLALARLDDNIYAGGQFTSAGGVAAANIAAWSTTGSTWSPLAAGVSGSVAALDATDNALYVGGTFTTAGGIAGSNVASWSPSTNSWQSLTSGVNGSVSALDATDDTVYVGGAFTTAGGVAASKVAAWSRSSGTWSPLGAGVIGSVYALQFDEARGLLYVGGAFLTAGGSVVNNVAVWDTGISAWVPLQAAGGIGVTPSRAYALALDDTVLYLGGVFAAAGGVSATRIAQWAWTAPTPAASPASGQAGVSIDVVGDALVGVTAVRFDGTPIAYQRDDSTSLSFVVPGGLTEGTYSIEVDAVGGTGVTSYTVGNPTPPPAPTPVLIAPGAPSQAAVTPGNASATVTWNPPASPGTFPIDGYVVNASPSGRSCTTSTTTCTVTGLTNGTEYTFTVTASSAAGTGLASAPSAPVTPRTIPGSPTAVTATPGDSRATINWSAPADDGGSRITGYRVTTIPTSDGCTVTTTTCTLDGLTNGREYVVSVVATNAAGSSAPATATVTPRGKASIVITGTRSKNDASLVKVLGTVTNLDVATVQPYVRLGRAREFQPSLTQATVGDEGRFRWQRITSKRISVYVEAAGEMSNRVTLPAR